MFNIFGRKKKKFRLASYEIRPLAPGKGGCIATDMITVDGLKVALMYREQPDNDVDSGWRFLSGRESQSYLDEPSHSEVYDVNTIANYDPDVIPFLDAPIGSAFERTGGAGDFVEAESPPNE